MWHTKTANEVAKLLNCNIKIGLAEEEANKKKKKMEKTN